MEKLLRHFLVATLVFLVLASLAATVKPVKGDESDSAKDLEAMFSGDHGDANGSREIYQLYGGQVRPIQPNITTGTLYDVPYQDYFNDFTIFGDFLGLFEDVNLTHPQINSSWRKTYLDSIAATAPSAKGRMTQAGRSHLLKPLLINEPEF
ncbi:Uncharacterised protein [uncultured archaeon]|nr:Uncharacterised protein [uncultured archaeon]